MVVGLGVGLAVGKAVGRAVGIVDVGGTVGLADGNQQPSEYAS